MIYQDFRAHVLLVNPQNKLSDIVTHAQFKKDDNNFVSLCVRLPDNTFITLDFSDILDYSKKVGII